MRPDRRRCGSPAAAAVRTIQGRGRRPPSATRRTDCHSPTLTQSEPPNLSSAQPGALYYVDTSGGQVDTKQFTGTVTFTNNMMGRWALRAPGIGTNLVMGQSITVQGASNPQNNSTFTIAVASTNARSCLPCSSYGAAAASTTIVPTIPKPQCGMQKYGNVPAVLKVWL